MNNEQFWQLIQSVHLESLGDMEKKCALITEMLANLSASDAVKFQSLFDQRMDEAYTWELWGAAYVIGGGCSDDAFTDFRSSLISRGEVSFKAALLNPDSLADQILDDDAFFYEGYQYAVSEGVEKAVGSRPERYASHPSDPSGEEWSEEDDSLKKLYPKLWAKAEGSYDSNSMSYIDSESSDDISPAPPWFKPFVKIQVIGISLIIIVFVLNYFFGSH